MSERSPYRFLVWDLSGYSRDWRSDVQARHRIQTNENRTVNNLVKEDRVLRKKKPVTWGHMKGNSK